MRVVADEGMGPPTWQPTLATHTTLATHRCLGYIHMYSWSRAVKNLSRSHLGTTQRAPNTDRLFNRLVI